MNFFSLKFQPKKRLILSQLLACIFFFIFYCTSVKASGKNREVALARSRTHCLVWLTPQGFLSVFSPAELRRATLLLAQADARTHHQRAAVVFYLDQLSVLWCLQAFCGKKDAPPSQNTLSHPSLWPKGISWVRVSFLLAPGPRLPFLAVLPG